MTGSAAQALSVHGGVSRLVWPSLVLDVLPDDRQRRTPAACCEIARRPQVIPVCPYPVVLAKHPAGDPFECVHELGDRDLRRVLNQEVHVIVFAVALQERGLEVLARGPEHSREVIDHLSREHSAPVLSNEDQVDVHGRNNVPTTAVLVRICHRPSLC